MRKNFISSKRESILKLIDPGHRVRPVTRILIGNYL